MDTSKIIRGVVSNGRYTVTVPIVKEDHGLYLKIEGVELPSTYEVDFSNSESSGTSVTMIGNADGVLIPRQFIDSGKDVFAFLYHVGSDFGRTVYKFRIPNKVRPDRTDEQPTPEEQSVIEQTISALNDAVESAQEAQQAIEDMSVSAQTLAEGATATVTKTESEGVVHLEFGIPKGQTGDSPTITASKTGKTTSIYVDGSEVAQIEDGTDGIDGISPSVSVTDITGGHRVVITDKDGEKSFDVEDGATGATPNLTIGTVETLESTESATASITGTPENPVLNLGIPQGEQGEVTLEEFYKAFPTDTASGAVASFSDGADNIPLKSLIVNIDPVQDTSSGDPSPENICPISGWTGMEIQHTGKNLLPLNIWNGLSYNSSVGAVFTPTMSDRSWTQNADSISYATSATYTNMSLMTSLLPKGTYHYDLHRGSGERLRYTRYVLDKDFTVISASSSSNMSNAGASVTLDDYGYIAFRLDNGSTASQTITMTAQITVGDTETAYEPYNGTTLPISWQTEAGTVYGGKLDVLSGKLTVYPEYDSYNGETLTGRWISDRDVYAVGTTPTIGAQVVNIGAQGTEIQLEPHEIASLLGQNNIFADTGDTEVEYRADTKLYIERLTAPDSADMIADSNIVSGQYFMVGNSLYKATSNIANGGQIIVGTNCIRKSLSEALNEINA